MPRYTAAVSAGMREGKRYAVLDRFDLQGGKGMRRVSFHRTWKQAKAEAARLNAAATSTTTTKET